LKTSLAALAQPGAMLWLTAQGQFTDVRQRPARLRGGVGHLLHRLPHGHIVPLAVEYPFWNERTPEALLRFGPPLAVSGRERSPADWTQAVEHALEATQDALAREAVERDPARFDALIEGKAGVGGVYDLWRRLAAALRGRRFRPEHEQAP
jgi:hypothetical protein